jgi:hypothetical protein
MYNGTVGGRQTSSSCSKVLLDMTTLHARSKMLLIKAAVPKKSLAPFTATLAGSICRPAVGMA